MTFLDATDATPLGELGRIGKTGYAGAMNDSGGQVSMTQASERLGIGKERLRLMVDEGLIRATRSPWGSRPHGRLGFEAADVEKLREDRARLHKARMILRRRAFGDIELLDTDLLTTGEAGLLLGCTATTIALAVRAGEIEATSRTPRGHIRIGYGTVRAILESREKR